MPFRVRVYCLYGRWTGRSRPVQDRRCTSVTAVRRLYGYRVSPKFFQPCRSICSSLSSSGRCCAIHSLQETERSPNLSSRHSFLTSRSSSPSHKGCFVVAVPDCQVGAGRLGIGTRQYLCWLLELRTVEPNRGHRLGTTRTRQPS